MANDYLSIVLPFEGGRGLRENELEHTLFAIAGSSCRALEIVVVVSSEESKSLVEMLLKKFVWDARSILRVEVGKGERKAAAYNSGVALATGRYLALLEPGVLPYEHAYSQLLNLCKKEQAARACGGSHFCKVVIEGNSRKIIERRTVASESLGMCECDLHSSIYDIKGRGLVLPCFEEGEADETSKKFLSRIAGICVDATAVTTQPLFLVPAC